MIPSRWAPSNRVWLQESRREEPVRRRPGGGVLLAAVTVVAALIGPAGAADKIEYNRHIRPILAENCFACHGADSASRKADLRLDRRDDAVKAGAIVAGKPDESELVRRLFSAEPNETMPPPKTLKRVTAEQKELLRRWITAGAEYQPHWSFLPPTRAPLPAVKNAAWVRNPLDRFILAELERRGLQPAPEADRPTLIRRLSLDLTGLPPTPAEVEAFVSDPAPDAYDKLVDRLLQSARWGEHRGRYWLDAARYGDTHGIHIDNFREIWAYRDWVINAFNNNVPFDRFTIEQLAGDLLPNRTLDQQVASGFNRCNITTSEGGAIAEEYLVLYARDRVETTAQVWMGLTAGCAVCHDHKFDPLSQKEFYQLAAFFNNTTQAAMDGNIKDTPPIVTVPPPEDRARAKVLEGEVAEAKRLADGRKQVARAEFDKWSAQNGPGRVAARIPHEGLRFHALLGEGAGSRVTLTENGQARQVVLEKDAIWAPGHVADKAYKVGAATQVASEDAGDFEKDQPFSAAAWLRLPRNGLTGSVLARMTEENNHRGWDIWLEGNKIASHLVSEWDKDAVKVISNTALKANQWHHVAVTYDGSAKAAGLKLYVDGVVQPTTVAVDKLKGTIRTDKPLKVGQRHNSARLDNAMIQDVRVYGRALSAEDVGRVVRNTRAAWVAAKPAVQRSQAEKDDFFGWWLGDFDKPSQELNAKVAKLEQEQAALKSRGTITHVMQEKSEEAMAYLLYRGDYDKRRDPVKPGTPAALPPMPSDLPRNRLGFAQWLLRPEHPLTTRATVNRFWQELFGTGLVRTAGDLGTSGELPSHPELLDWLALEFRQDWDVKKFFKLLVTSATYRQAAVVSKDKLEKDPQNRLLSRGPRFRMDAEMIRDYALAASGLLVSKLGGPSVKPYQPEGVWEAVAMIGSNTRDYKQDTGPNLYRRSMYTFWKRSAPPASMDIFNAPSRETCTVRRERTNTPLQALVTLNDPQLVEAARHLAQAAIKEAGDKLDARADYIAKRLLARSLRAEEKPIVEGSVSELLAHYKAHPEEAKKLVAVGESKADASLDVSTLAAWTMLTNQLMNLDEVLNK